jgi:hypothetical protein
MIVRLPREQVRPADATASSRPAFARFSIAVATVCATLLLAPPARAQMATGMYLGNGVAGRAITGIGFRPDAVIIKADFSLSTVMRTSTMTGDNTKPLLNATGLAPNMIQALDSDGFTVGNDATVNGTGAGTCGTCTYYWTAFKANANVKVGSYTGTGLAVGDTLSIFSVGFSPEYVIVLGSGNRWAMHRTSLGGTLAMRFNGSGYPINDAITATGAIGFTVMLSGSNPGNSQNTSGEIYHYVAWNAVPGKMAIGSYTGDGSPNRPITGLGFKPEYVIDGTTSAAFSPHQKSDKMAAGMSANFASAFAANMVQNLLTDGFEVGTDPDVNGNGSCGGACTYTWAAFNAYTDCCNPLATTQGAGTITVTLPGSFEATFSTAVGGGIQTFYDLAEDSARSYDLAGGTTEIAALHDDSIGSGGLFYDTDQNTTGAKLDLLEATPTRVKVRQEAFYQQVTGAALLGGPKAVGDYSLYPAGRLALEWNRRTTAAVPYTSQDFDLCVHSSTTAPFNAWTPYSQTSGAFSHPAGDDFAMLQAEVAGARTDFLTVMAKDWTVGNGYQESAGQVDTFSSAGNQWQEVIWNVTTSGTIPAGANETWNFLTYFKPTGFAGNTDVKVTSRATDYRTPSTPTVVSGTGWFDAAENTVSPTDFYNESEGAYAFNLDPVSGLDFDLDGSATTRYRPFFKIRQWRSLGRPASMTLEGIPLTADVDYKADVKPLARGHFTGSLLWHSTLESSAATSTPDVGTTTFIAAGVTFVAARYGNGALFTAGTHRIEFPQNNLSASNGTAEFWYQPTYAHADGVRHVLWNNQGDATHFFALEKTAANNLEFTINNGGTLTTARITPPNYSWRVADWIHLRASWDASAAAGNQVRLFVNEVEPTHTDIGTYTTTGMVLGFSDIGNLAAGGAAASGILDEFHLYSGTATPARIASGGLTTNTDEYLADPAKNFTLALAPVDVSRRGAYLYLGADAKFRGLNVALATLGAGVAAGALDWEYWDGAAWSNLEAVAGFADSTGSFTRSGNVSWTADPPTWSVYSVNGGPELFYVRAKLPVTSGPYTTSPVEGLIKTDVLLVQYCNDVTAAAQTFHLNAPVPTAVMLESFEARGAEVGIDLSWSTVSEIENLGFVLYRSSSREGPYERITPSLVAGLGGSAAGRDYAYHDATAASGGIFFYELEDVDTSGHTQRHEPVSAVAGVAGSGEDDGSPSPSSGGGGDSDGGGTSGGGRTTPPSVRTAYGSPGPATLRVVARDARSAVLELTTPGFVAITEPDGTVRIEAPGLDVTSPPGAPALPTRRTWVGAVAGRQVRIASITASDTIAFAGVRPAAAPAADIAIGASGTVRPASLPRRPSAEFARLFPREAAKVAASGFQGDTKKALVELAPLRWDGASGQLRLARRLRVRLEFTGTAGDETSLGGARGRRPRHREASVTSAILARLLTVREGLYGVRFEDVFPAARAALSVAGLRLARLGIPVPFHVAPQASVFGPGSTLYFLSEGEAANEDGATAVYELTAGPPGLSMALASELPAGPAIAPGWGERRFEQDRYYQSALLDAPDLWLWDVIVSGTAKTYGFALDDLAAADAPAHLKVFLQGASDYEADPDHHVRAFVNGALVGEARWNAKMPSVVEVDVDAGILQKQGNTLRLENVGDTGAAYSMVFLDRFEVRYPRTLAAAGGVFDGAFAEGGRAMIDGLPAGSFVVDVAPNATRWVGSTVAAASGLSFRVEAGHRYRAFAPESVQRPVVAAPAPSLLKSRQVSADYLLITPRAFLDAAQPLLELRESQGLRTRAVPLEEIADEFGHGETHPEAIRDFLEFAYQRWRRPAPRYVLLLGDATYDPKDHLHTGVADRVPAFPLRTSYLWTASDPAYAQVNGDDALPDLAIGRLPAANAEEARIMIDKILAFEAGPHDLRGDALLVADNADTAGNFEHDADDLAGSALADRRTEKIYLRDLGASARLRIRNALDHGPALVNYIGHGGIAVWASENVWNNLDIDSLAPQASGTPLPLLFTLNCLNGYFHFPSLNSLTEQFLKAENKGAVAAFSPSGLSVDDPAHLYHMALVEEVVSGRHARLGDAVMAAQARYADAGGLPELLSIYHLFGDPAMRIR